MSLAIKAVHGAAWTIGVTVGARGIATVASMVLTYFVAPSVMGEFALAHTITLNALIFSNLGLDRYTVSYPKAGRDVVFHATVVHLALGYLALAGVLILREPLTNLVNGGELLLSYLPWMTLAVVIERTGQIPERILSREMRYRVIGTARATGNIMFGLVTIGLAWMEWGGMSLVMGNVARSGVQSLMFASSVHWREWLQPCRLRWQTYKKMFDFGIPLAIATASHLAARTWDNALISRLLGTSALGAYNQAYNLADIPAVQVGENIGDVLLPSFANIEDPEYKREALVRATGLLMLIMAPMAIGLGAVAQTLVTAVLGPTWWGVWPLLSILSVMSVVRPLGWTVATYLQAQGRTRIILFLDVFLLGAVALFVLLFIYLGLHFFGEEASALYSACVGVGVAFTVQAAFSLWLAEKVDRVPFRKNLRFLLEPVAACIPMVAAVLAVRFGYHRIFPDGPRLVLLALEVMVGAAIYVPAAFVVAPTTARDCLQLIHKAFLKRRQRDSSPPDSPVDPE